MLKELLTEDRELIEINYYFRRRIELFIKLFRRRF